MLVNIIKQSVIAALSLVVGLAPSAAATGPTPDACVEGTVVRIVDGDTLSIRTALGVERVRISQIDAPESAQPFGNQAKQCLGAVLAGGSVRMCREGTDRYGRTIASLAGQGQDVGAAMGTNGCAWAYSAYLAEGSPLPALQAAARAAGRGLWAGVQVPQAPWQYRAAATDTPFGRIVAWIEYKFPEYTPHPIAAKATQRCYANKLCLSTAEGSVFLHDSSDARPIDVGSVTLLLQLAGAEGF